MDCAPFDAWKMVTCSSEAAAYSHMALYLLEVAAVGVMVGVGVRHSWRASALSYPLRWSSRLVACVMMPYSLVKESLVVAQD